MRAFPAHSIGAVAKQTGCSVPTIRYYEHIGLLPTAPRSEGNRRHYDAAAIRRLLFIRRCRDLGFSLEQVRELVSLTDQPERDCVEVRDLAQVRLAAVRDKLAELQLLEARLREFVHTCNVACTGGATMDCRILELLADPQTPRPGTPSAQQSCYCS